MRFLIDAQLPRRLAHWLKTNGHDALHTMDLPTGNRTADMEIGELSIRERRVVVTKDEDFVDTFLLRRTPHKLLVVSTGNTSNHELLRLFADNLGQIIQALEESDFVELGSDSLISRE